MQLTDYTIHGRGDKKIIHLETPELIILEEYLNSDIVEPSEAELVLTVLYELRDSWNDLDNYIEEKSVSGLWDEENLSLAGETGNLFTMRKLGYEDLEFAVNVDTRYIYIYDNFQEELPRSELSLDELIDILEQWKEL